MRGRNEGEMCTTERWERGKQAETVAGARYTKGEASLSRGRNIPCSVRRRRALSIKFQTCGLLRTVYEGGGRVSDRSRAAPPAEMARRGTNVS